MKPPQPSASPTPLRAWRGGLCNCCGECSEYDLLACSAVLQGCLPCVWGVAQRRWRGGGPRAAVLWSFLLALMISVPLYVFYAGSVIGNVAVAQHLANPYQDASQNLADVAPILDRVNIYNVCMAGIVLGCALAGLTLAAYRRTQMRRKLGLPGSCCGDWLRWVFCCWCTACQEARTLRYLPVNEGVVGAESRGVWGSAAAAAAPAVQVMDKV